MLKLHCTYFTNPWRPFMVAAIYFSFCTCGFSQGEDLVKIAMDNFHNKGSKLLWVKDMSGFLDGMHAVRMVLVTDNDEFHGCYQLLSSGQIFNLDGEFVDDAVILNEYNNEGTISGIIKGELNDNAFYAEWSDFKNLERLPLNLFTEPPYDTPCGDIGWILYSHGNEKVKDITLEKVDQDKQISFTINDSLYIVKLECDNDECSNLYSVQPDENDALTINVSRNINALHLKINSNTISESFVCQASKKLTLDCITYADYCHRSDVIIPASGDRKLDKWVKSMLVPFEKKCGKEIVIIDQEGISIIDRFTNTAHGSMKVDLFQDTLFSGLFVFQSSDNASLIEKSFIYDLNKNKSLTLADFYISEASVVNKINELIDKKKSELFLDDDKSWFKNASFDLITLGEKGFVCRNKFSTIYGQETISLPYHLFADYLNPKRKYNLN